MRARPKKFVCINDDMNEDMNQTEVEALRSDLLEFYESLFLQFRCEEGWRQTIPVVDGVVERTPKGYGLRVDSPNPRRQDGILTHQYGEIYYSNVPCGNPRLKLATQNGSFCAIN